MLMVKIINPSKRSTKIFADPTGLHRVWMHDRLKGGVEYFMLKADGPEGKMHSSDNAVTAIFLDPSIVFDETGMLPGYIQLRTSSCEIIQIEENQVAHDLILSSMEVYL